MTLSTSTCLSGLKQKKSFFQTPEAWKASKTPSRFRRPAPFLGEHNEYVLGELLGLDEGTLGQLYETEVTAKVPPKPRSEGESGVRRRSGNISYPAPSVEAGTLAYIDDDYQKRLGVE